MSDHPKTPSSELPVPRSNGSETPRSPFRVPTSARVPRSKILIVDDEKSIRTTLSAFLRDEGYDVEIAEDAQCAQKLLSPGSFDVVVSDIILPRMSGVQLLQAIRKTDPDVQVIMMTGEPTLETAVEAVRAGARDYLTKPVGKPAILRSVSNALKIKELVDEKLRLETENRDYQKNLEQMVGQRTHDLEDALARLKNAQRQLIQQERLNALGQMASGIAHDFNNALMPIVGYTDMLLNQPNALDDREEVIRELELIRTGSEDARHIVRRLRQIYKEEDVEYQPLDLGKVVESAVSLTTPKWKEEMNAKGLTVEMATDFGSVPSIRGNANELREALTNLILNAVDAMPNGGVITLRLTCEGGRSVVLEVRDTGIGMDEEALRHCLEPFFTTKGMQGTGLGLSMVHGIAERHGGAVEIESKPGVGTTVRMQFPVPVELEGPEEQPEPEPEPLAPMHVLVIDDELRSRKLLAAFLEMDGHGMKSAEGGEKGLELLQNEEFDLVITDRAMPLMSGDQVAAEIARTRPGTPVIMLTGFGDIMKDRGELPPGVTCVITKPVTRKELRRVMSHVVRGKDA